MALPKVDNVDSASEDNLSDYEEEGQASVEEGLDAALGKGSTHLSGDEEQDSEGGTSNKGSPDQWVICCDLDSFSNAKFSTAFTYCRLSHCQELGIYEKREELTWEHGLHNAHAIQMVLADYAVPSERVMKVTAMCNLIASKTYEENMTTECLVQKLLDTLNEKLQHEMHFRFGNQVEKPFSGHDKIRGSTKLEESCHAEWMKLHPMDTLKRAKSNGLDDATRSSTPNEKKSNEAKEKPSKKKKKRKGLKACKPTKIS